MKNKQGELNPEFKKKAKDLLDQLKELFSAPEFSLELFHVRRLEDALFLAEGQQDKLSAFESTQDVFPLPAEDTATTDLHFFLFTDGGCRGNPGPGAWANLLQDNEGQVVSKSCGVEVNTTNNKMELTAAIEGLKFVFQYAEERQLIANQISISLYSDSKYVVEGVKSWLAAWKRRGWTKSEGQGPILNLELWKSMDMLMDQFKIVRSFWVKGHQGHPQNEFCDRLLNEALDDAGF